jgi:FkbM family methyltransferase
MDTQLDLSAFSAHEGAAFDLKTSLAFVSPAEQWHYAVSLLCSGIAAPAVVEIDTEVISGAAGYGFNDTSFSRYLTKEVVVGPEAGRTKIQILLEGSERGAALVIRNVSDPGERAAGVVHGVRIVSGSSYSSAEARSPDVSLFESFHDLEAEAEPGFVVDFLGARTRASTLWKSAQAFSGMKLPPPVQGDYRGDALEWIGLLKSVSAARDQWVMIELGAGHGPWSIAGGKAAALRGIGKIRLYAVEADPDRFLQLEQHFADNGFAPHEQSLIQGAVGVQRGSSHWRVADSSEDWSGRPLGDLGSPDYRGLEVGQTIEIPVVAMSDLLQREPMWDLVHLDVQGHEVDLCRSAVRELNERAR